ncbi:hypothetical protein [Alkalihalobacillus sp. R86527]|uniref:hypothetical protein n=1 Tax=Alkalihalobacillus sp. R86527 TaxID=3093863 RepID=UPI003671CA23
MKPEELKAEFARLKEEFLFNIEKELTEIKAKFIEEIESIQLEKLKSYNNEKLNQTYSTVTQSQNYKIVNGKVVSSEQEVDTSEITGRRISEQINKSVWEQIAKAQNKNDQK